MFTACWPRASTVPGSLSLHAPLLVPVGARSATPRLTQRFGLRARPVPTVEGMAERNSGHRDGIPNVSAANVAVPDAAVDPTERTPMDEPVTDLAPADVDEDAPTAGPPASPSERMRQERNRQLPVLLGAAVIAFTADLVSKLVVVSELVDRAPVVIVPRVLDLQLTRNPGAAFGLAGGATVLFTLVALAVVAFIVATARRLRSRGWAVSLGLLLGGALGNLGDRLFRDPSPLRGHVVDWIHLSHWPIFNLADTAIVLGGVIAVYLSVRGKRLDGTMVGEAEPASPAGSGSGDGERRDEGAA